MMFSKFGKLLTYQFHILLSKDEILSTSKPQTPIKATKAHKSKKSLPKTILDSDKPLIVTKPKSCISPKPMPMFRSQSRENFYKATSNKDLVPPIGYYNCKYDIVSKSPKSVIFKKRAKSSAKIVKNELDKSDSFMKYSPVIKKKGVNFKKQIGRKDIFVRELNENRFLSYNNMPEVCSNFKRINTPEIKKYRKREDFIKGSSFCHSYNPDFKLVTEDLGKVHEFSKYSERKPLFEEKEDIRNYEIRWESVEKKKYSADFSKSCVKLKEDSILTN